MVLKVDENTFFFLSNYTRDSLDNYKQFEVKTFLSLPRVTGLARDHLAGQLELQKGGVVASALSRLCCVGTNGTDNMSWHPPPFISF